MPHISKSIGLEFNVLFVSPSCLKFIYSTSVSFNIKFQLPHHILFQSSSLHIKPSQKHNDSIVTVHITSYFLEQHDLFSL